MIITIKTLQTKTFKVEIDESETVSARSEVVKGVKSHATVKWIVCVGLGLQHGVGLVNYSTETLRDGDIEDK